MTYKAGFERKVNEKELIMTLAIYSSAQKRQENYERKFLTILILISLVHWFWQSFKNHRQTTEKKWKRDSWWSELKKTKQKQILISCYKFNKYHSIFISGLGLEKVWNNATTWKRPEKNNSQEPFEFSLFSRLIHITFCTKYCKFEFYAVVFLWYIQARKITE